MDGFIKIVRTHPHVLYSARFYKLEVSEVLLTNVDYNVGWDWDEVFE